MDLEPTKFNSKLKEVLVHLHNNPYPYLPSPPKVDRRASVALILRVNPSYNTWPGTTLASQQAWADQDTEQKLESFFDQDWVKHGHLEALFIKRASRKGDRWNGHVAFPGGRRDPEDEDDLAAAVRETMEEVGIDLTRPGVLHVGNLPQRLVTTSWGKVPLMTLCPYVFLVTTHDIPPLRLQPTEIASAHWVPLRMLLAQDNQTNEYQDISSRLAKQETGFRRYLLRFTLGPMAFSAVRLMPSESLISEPPAGPEFEMKRQTDTVQGVLNWLGVTRAHTASPDLLLWGLTLGCMADFLDFVAPQESGSLWTHLWRYPTFSMPDVRLWVWLVGYRFRAQKYKLIKENPYCSEPATIELGLDSLPMPADSEPIARPKLMDEQGRWGSRSSRVGFMLDGYYDTLRKAVAAALLFKGVTFVAAAWWAVGKYRRR